MATGKGVIQGYAAKAAVDSSHQVIVVADVIGSGAEQNMLVPMIDNSAAVRSEATLITADAGYHSDDNMRELQERCIAALIADNRMRKRDERIDNAHHKAKEDPLYDKTATKAIKLFRPEDCWRRRWIEPCTELPVSRLKRKESQPRHCVQLVCAGSITGWPVAQIDVGCAGRPARTKSESPSQQRCSEPCCPRVMRWASRGAQRSVDRGTCRPAIEPRKKFDPGADAVRSAEGNMHERAIASARATRRGRRPWHARTLLAREPGDLQSDRRCLSWPAARIGKVRSRRR